MTEKPPRALTVASFFCGIGGLDLGFTWEGYEVIWANDILPSAVMSYKLNHGLSPVCQDITTVAMDDIPDADVYIGGPPCQSFSLVGRREPDDPRGHLVFRFLQIIGLKRPSAVVIENVPGMASSMVNGERVPLFLKRSLQELGYQVKLLKLNAVDYLVPQLRTRLILVGNIKAALEVPDPNAFARECYGIDLETYDCSAKAAIGDLGPCSQRKMRVPYASVEPSRFATLMRSKDLSDVSLHQCPRMSMTDSTLIQHIPPGGNYRDIPDGISPGRVMKFKRTGGRTTTYGRLHPDRPSYTINTYFRRPNVGCNFHYLEPRLITPREAMRLQSIPDHFELEYKSQDGRNALIGNAVPPLLARAVAWRLRKCMTQPFDA